MKTSTLAGSLLAGLALIATPLHAQAVVAEVVVRGGPIAGHAILGNQYSSYQHPRRVVVVERYAPRVIVVERLRHRHHLRHWKRNGYRRVVVYYMDGRYYDRYQPSRRGYRTVMVYERGGRYYRDDDDRARSRNQAWYDSDAGD